MKRDEREVAAGRFHDAMEHVRPWPAVGRTTFGNRPGIPQAIAGRDHDCASWRTSQSDGQSTRTSRQHPWRATMSGFASRISASSAALSRQCPLTLHVRTRIEGPGGKANLPQGTQSPIIGPTAKKPASARTQRRRRRRRAAAGTSTSSGVTPSHRGPKSTRVANHHRSPAKCIKNHEATRTARYSQTEPTATRSAQRRQPRRAGGPVNAASRIETGQAGAVVAAVGGAPSQSPLAAESLNIVVDCFSESKLPPRRSLSRWLSCCRASPGIDTFVL